MSNRPSEKAGEAFPITRWSLVSDVRQGDRERALAELCEIYWYPVYAYVRRYHYKVPMGTTGCYRLQC